MSENFYEEGSDLELAYLRGKETGAEINDALHSSLAIAEAKLKKVREIAVYDAIPKDYPDFPDGYDMSECDGYRKAMKVVRQLIDGEEG